MNRIISTAISIICILSGATAAGVSAAPAVEQWKIFELSFRQKAGQHPFDNIDSPMHLHQWLRHRKSQRIL